jgi:predicted ABC-type ATPase
MGGHSVPTETIRRRYEAGLKNFFNFYCPLSDSWQLYDNSNTCQPNLIASKIQGFVNIKNDMMWKQLVEKYNE